ncbi:hypothetical protein BD560DRAFT_317938, partial [Blakeslea trispora]
HYRLQMPLPVEDPLCFLLNILSTKKPHSSLRLSPWKIHWPTICHIRHDMDYLTHSNVPPSPNDPSSILLQWL